MKGLKIIKFNNFLLCTFRKSWTGFLKCNKFSYFLGTKLSSPKKETKKHKRGPYIMIDRKFKASSDSEDSDQEKSYEMPSIELSHSEEESTIKKKLKVLQEKAARCANHAIKNDGL